jgi:catechol 2,3-dioxygenase-like lactoylglutathione lyase family enzyme
MEITSLRQIGLPARDLDRAVEYYRAVLGLPFVARYGALAFFDLDGVRLLLEAGEDPTARAGVIYLEVDDIEAAHAALVGRGVSFQSAPHLVFRDDQGTFGPVGEEEWMAFFVDSEGNQLALSSRIRR